MAANSYYDTDRFSFTSSPRPGVHQESPRPNNNDTSPHIPLQEYRPYQGYQASPAPSYHSQPSHPSQQTPSLYASSFQASGSNDHVYSSPNHGLSPAPSYAPGGSTPSFGETAPLATHAASPGKLGKSPLTDGEDCVYDASAMDSHRRSGYGKRKNTSQPWVLRYNDKKIALVTYLLTLVQLIVFLVEIIRNAQLTGSPIEVHPSFNPMIGPSPYVLINMGARYVPCMHNLKGIQGRTTPINWPCPNTTSNTDVNCTLSDLCGFSGVPNPLYNGDIDQKPEPDQWFRFIVPMFLHAGIVHIAFNMLLQLTLGKEMEFIIGHLRYLVVYLASGIFGFVLGGNYAAEGIASTGASGALFGVVALTLLDLLYNWSDRPKPWWDLFWIGVDVAVSFVLGLLPGLDNFSHIGGFFMGLALGICILRSPAALRQRIGDREFEPTYSPMLDSKTQVMATSHFVKSPVGFFRERKPAWWIWLAARALALTFVLIVFILLLNNFYKYRKTCGWCKYLSCIPIKDWCSLGDLDFKTYNITNNSTSKRSVFESWDSMAKLYLDEELF